MKSMRILFFLLTLSLFCPAALLAGKGVNTTFFGTAIKGYDPVAYFEDGEPIKGHSDFSCDWAGAKWHFANAEHLRAFMIHPEKYAPQYGGYCAWAVAQGKTADIDPHAWRIVAGKLYLNYSPEIQERWEEDISGNIAKADENWPKLRDEE